MEAGVCLLSNKGGTATSRPLPGERFFAVKIMRKEGGAEGKKVQVKKKTFAFFRIEFIPSFFSFSFFFTKIY
jgi:hypothetical protein